jgi:glutamine synthetase
MLMIDVLRETFDKHDYTVLLHEKPFANANGSAKHCNWSILINKGENLLNLYDPGINPQQNK